MAQVRKKKHDRKQNTQWMTSHVCWYLSRMTKRAIAGAKFIPSRETATYLPEKSLSGLSCQNASGMLAVMGNATHYKEMLKETPAWPTNTDFNKQSVAQRWSNKKRT